MMPHVAVFGSIGFHLKREADAAAGLARPSPDVFERSTLAMPLGMMANAVLQVVFREFARGSALEGPRRRLAATCAVASLTYAAVVAAGVPLVQSLETAAALWGAAVGAVVVHIAIALAMLRTHVHAPRGKTKQKALAVLARGVGTALIFLVAMAVARTLPALSGVLVNFPFVTLGTLTSVWLGQGEDVAVGAIAPMAIGMTSAALKSAHYTRKRASLTRKLSAILRRRNLNRHWSGVRLPWVSLPG